MTAGRAVTVGTTVDSDDQVRLTLIDDDLPGKPTWSHVFVPKHLTVEADKVTVSRSCGGQLWPADMGDTSPGRIQGMIAVVTWREETYSGRITAANASVAEIFRDR